MIRAAIGVAIALCLSSAANAELLQFSFLDGTNDQTRPTGADLLSISVVFDNTTGAYTTTLRSTTDAPFAGVIGINANFADVDTPAYTSSQSYFFDNLRTIGISEPTTSTSWSGTYSALKFWKAGDRVVTSSDPSGIVSNLAIHSFGSNFTSYLDFKYTSTDEIDRMSVATISTVPEPGTYALTSLGLTLILLKRRRQDA